METKRTVEETSTAEKSLSGSKDAQRKIAMSTVDFVDFHGGEKDNPRERGTENKKEVRRGVDQPIRVQNSKHLPDN